MKESGIGSNMVLIYPTDRSDMNKQTNLSLNMRWISYEAFEQTMNEEKAKE